MWVLDVLIIIYVAIFMIRQCMSGIDPSGRTMPRKIWFLTCIVLKIIAQVLLCIRLEYAPLMASYFVAVPFWLLLLAIIGDVSRCVLLRVLPYSSINLCGCPHVICKTD
jgi:O-antigen/teichoic acid export membrane protein